MPRMDAASKTNWLEVLRNAPEATMGETIVRLARAAAEAHREEAEAELRKVRAFARVDAVHGEGEYEQGGWHDSDGSGSGDAVVAAAAGGAPGSVGKEAD